MVSAEFRNTLHQKFLQRQAQTPGSGTLPTSPLDRERGLHEDVKPVSSWSTRRDVMDRLNRLTSRDCYRDPNSFSGKPNEVPAPSLERGRRLSTTASRLRMDQDLLQKYGAQSSARAPSIGPLKGDFSPIKRVLDYLSVTSSLRLRPTLTYKARELLRTPYTHTTKSPYLSAPRGRESANHLVLGSDSYVSRIRPRDGANRVSKPERSSKASMFQRLLALNPFGNATAKERQAGLSTGHPSTPTGPLYGTTSHSRLRSTPRDYSYVSPPVAKRDQGASDHPASTYTLRTGHPTSTYDSVAGNPLRLGSVASLLASTARASEAIAERRARERVEQQVEERLSLQKRENEEREKKLREALEAKLQAKTAEDSERYQRLVETIQKTERHRQELEAALQKKEATHRAAEARQKALEENQRMLNSEWRERELKAKHEFEVELQRREQEHLRWVEAELEKKERETRVRLEREIQRKFELERQKLEATQREWKAQQQAERARVEQQAERTRQQEQAERARKQEEEELRQQQQRFEHRTLSKKRYELRELMNQITTDIKAASPKKVRVMEPMDLGFDTKRAAEKREARAEYDAQLAAQPPQTEYESQRFRLQFERAHLNRRLTEVKQKQDAHHTQILSLVDSLTDKELDEVHRQPAPKLLASTLNTVALRDIDAKLFEAYLYLRSLLERGPITMTDYQDLKQMKKDFALFREALTKWIVDEEKVQEECERQFFQVERGDRQGLWAMLKRYIEGETDAYERCLDALHKLLLMNDLQDQLVYLEELMTRVEREDFLAPDDWEGELSSALSLSPVKVPFKRRMP